MTSPPPANPPRDQADVRLLVALRTASVHLCADELALTTNTPRENIGLRLQALCDAGFDIESKPGFGYRLLGSPDRIIADDLWARLDKGSPTRLVEEILVFEETGSTNDVAAQLGRQGAAGGLIVFAERQTAGRGRFGRRWDSASHRGLWFSLLLRPSFPPAHWTKLTTWAAVAVAAAFESAAERPASIKWPNDVFLEGKKAAGILIEMGSGTDHQPFAVVGIGANVNHAPDDFPEELRTAATSVRQAAGFPIDRPALAAAILRELDSHFRLLPSNFDAILADAARRSVLIGHWVRADSGKGIVEGVAEGLDGDGLLLVRTADGALQRLGAGEVTLHPSSSFSS